MRGTEGERQSDCQTPDFGPPAVRCRLSAIGCPLSAGDRLSDGQTSALSSALSGSSFLRKEPDVTRFALVSYRVGRVERGDFSTLWRLCIESPSQPKLAFSLPNKRLSYWRLAGFGRNDRGGGIWLTAIRCPLSA